jgi:drug/metabolite transporter (DMT)-like permease
MSGVAIGAAFLIASSLVATLEVICVRILSDQVTGGQIVLFRAMGQVVLTTVLVLTVVGPSVLRTQRIGVHILRGVLSAASWWMYYTSFRLLDLALATTLSFSSQIFVVILAAIFLREKLSGRRIGATLLGLFGIAVATQIWNVKVADGQVFYGIASAFLGAVMLVLTASLSRTERTLTIMFYIGVIVFLSALPQAALDWRPIGAREYILLSLMGILGTTSMWLMVEAYRHAEASALAPFPYSRLLFSATAGIILFGETVRTETLMGAALIVASALLIILEPGRILMKSAERSLFKGGKS